MLAVALLRRFAPALVAGTLVLAGCGSGGGSEEATATTTTAAPATTADSTSTTAGSEGGGPTAAQLEAILPTPTEIGDGWMGNSTPQVPDAAETATETACPDAADLLAAPADDEVTGTFTGPGEETVQVSLAAGVEPIDAAAATSAVDAIDACPPVNASEDGLAYAATFDAKVADTAGDGGISLVVTTTVGTAGNSYELATYRLVFTVGSVGVTVTGLDGVAEDGTVSRVERSDVEALASELAGRVASL